jgi:uncharacterized membrane protein YoaK (UPF0700 family)
MLRVKRYIRGYNFGGICLAIGLMKHQTTSLFWHWFLLSFNGGCINAGGFLATGRFVSHVTGFATLFGVDLTSHQVEAAFGILSVPLFFLAGAFIAGFLIDRPIHYGEKPHFDWVMGLSSLCLFLSAGMGLIFHFKLFGEGFGLKESYLLLVLLCLASGLQNAAITSSSGSTVRTTHLTGLTTDLGLGLARAFTFDLKRDSIKKETRANYLRAGSIISFVVGSAFGAWLFLRVGYRGFVLSGLIAAYAAWHGRNAKVEAHRI